MALPIRGLVIINATDKDCIVTADNGDVFPCPALVIATWSLPSTLRVTAQMVAAPTNGKSCNVITTDADTQNSTAQLATLSGSASSVASIPVYTVATFPPAAPTDGQLAVILPGPAGVRWLLQFNAATSSWDVLGGSHLVIPFASPVGSGAWREETFVAVPRAGTYDVEFTGVSINNNVIGESWQGGVSAGAAVPATFTFMNDFYAANRDATISTIRERLGLVAGQHASLMLNGPVGGGTFNVHGKVMPVTIQ